MGGGLGYTSALPRRRFHPRVLRVLRDHRVSSARSSLPRVVPPYFGFHATRARQRHLGRHLAPRPLASLVGSLPSAAWYCAAAVPEASRRSFHHVALIPPAGGRPAKSCRLGFGNCTVSTGHESVPRVAVCADFRAERAGTFYDSAWEGTGPGVRPVEIVPPGRGRAADGAAAEIVLRGGVSECTGFVPARAAASSDVGAVGYVFRPNHPTAG